MRSITIALLAVAAAGCAVGPDYEEPKTAAPGAYDNAGQKGYSSDPIVVKWWKEFGDAKLDDLIARAMEGNKSVKGAMAVVREARALFAESEFDLTPDLRASGSYNRRPTRQRHG